MLSRRPESSPARLLLVNQHYYPDVASTGQHLTDLAEHLAGEGYAVEVLTGEKSVLDYLVKPARTLRDDALRQWVIEAIEVRVSRPAGQLVPADWNVSCKW